jgi:hypothetical protein
MVISREGYESKVVSFNAAWLYSNRPACRAKVWGATVVEFALAKRTVSSAHEGRR